MNIQPKKKSAIMKDSILVKAGIIGILTLLMLIPIGMVKSLIEERSNVSTHVQEDVTMKWGKTQRVTGPVLVIPYKTQEREKKYAHFLPNNYVVEGELKPDKKKDGILEILCYQSELDIKSKFNIKDYKDLEIKKEDFLWDEAYLQINISDPNGIKDQVIVTSGGKPLDIKAKISDTNSSSNGFVIPFHLNEENTDKEFSLDIKLQLGGSEGLYITPVGKRTSIHLYSSYDSAKFVYRNILPSSETTEKGFDAQWNLFDYNLNYTPMWTGENTDLLKNEVGVDLLLFVDHYQKNMRSVKYAILFIVLTFIVFFVVELTNNKQIHPVQYLLASFAIVLFYSLLLSLSEHVGFNWAYIISAIAIVCMLTAYTSSVFKSKKQTMLMSIFLTTLYIFLYVIIQAEEKSLLLGNIGLFIILGAVMYTSRKIEWYKDEPIEPTEKSQEGTTNTSQNEIENKTDSHNQTN